MSNRKTFSKPNLVNLISKDLNLVIYQFTHWLILQNGDYDVIIDFVLI